MERWGAGARGVRGLTGFDMFFVPEEDVGGGEGEEDGEDEKEEEEGEGGRNGEVDARLRHGGGRGGAGTACLGGEGSSERLVWVEPRRWMVESTGVDRLNSEGVRGLVPLAGNAAVNVALRGSATAGRS